MKREAVHHTKMKRLCRKLDIPLWQAVGLLESIWHIVARQTPRGDIGKLSDEDIAISIDYHGDEKKLIEALVESGWIDRNNQHRLVIHDWPDHAEDGVHMKIARAREFFIRQDPAGDTILERPNLRRLESRERTPIREFYDRFPISEQKTSFPQFVSTDSQSVRTDSQSVRTKWRSVRGPRLDPALTPPLHPKTPAAPDISFQPNISPVGNGHGWAEFIEAWEATGRATIAADLTECKKVFEKLALDDQIACVHGVRRDIELRKYSGPEFWPKPRKYVYEREWEREPQRTGKAGKLLEGVFDA